MRRLPRTLRVILLPVAVLAMIAGSSVSASAATLVSVNNDNAAVTVTLPAIGHGPVSLSMKY